MRRGEIWTVSGGKGYAGKPRPAVILQDDRFDGTASITICAFTTDVTEAPLFRLPVEPNEQNGLRTTCCFMVDNGQYNFGTSGVHSGGTGQIGRAVARKLLDQGW